MLERLDDLHADLFLDRVHAADVGERRSSAARRRTPAAPGGSSPAGCADAAFLVDVVVSPPLAAIDAQLAGKLRVGRRGIDLQRLAVLVAGALRLAGAQQQPRVQHVGPGRRVAPFDEILDDHQRLRIFLLLVIHAGQRRA